MKQYTKASEQAGSNYNQHPKVQRLLHIENVSVNPDSRPACDHNDGIFSYAWEKHNGQNFGSLQYQAQSQASGIKV